MNYLQRCFKYNRIEKIYILYIFCLHIYLFTIVFCQSHSLTFTFAFMFALCLVSGHTVQIIRAFFCFPVNGVLCFCLLLCHVSMLPCCQRRRFSFCSQKMSQFLKVITELSNAR